MDLFSYFLSFTARIAIGIGTLIGALLNILFLGAARSSNSSTATSTKLTKAQKSEEAENERLAGCRDVVLEFARVLGRGYLGLSRAKVSAGMNLSNSLMTGIQPEAFAAEINRRIAAMPGSPDDHLTSVRQWTREKFFSSTFQTGYSVSKRRNS